jgi:hypothetical protein
MWTNEFGPGGTANGGKYADKSYWIATEDWDAFFGNTDQNYPVDLLVYNKSGGFWTGYVPLFAVVGANKIVYYNDDGFSQTNLATAIRKAIDEMPAPGTGSLSVSSFNKTAALGGSVSDSFNLISSGTGNISYMLAIDYVGSVAPGNTYHTNNFESALGYTNSGAGLWSLAAGGTWNGNTQCASAEQRKTSIMTSGQFSTIGIGDRLWLEFRYGIAYQTGCYLKVEYYDGTSWQQVFYMGEGGAATAKIELPSKVANAQLRFEAKMVQVTGTHSIVRVDDVKVYSDDQAYRWLKFDQVNEWGEPTETGTISTGTSKNFNLTFDAADLTSGTYTADIKVTCTDPVNSPITLPVTFTVTSGTVTPATPANLTTSIVSGNVYINWDNSADATSYDVYSSANPYGTFTLLANVTNSEYTYTPGTNTKMFFYIVAKNSTKQSPPSIIVK